MHSFLLPAISLLAISVAASPTPTIFADLAPRTATCMCAEEAMQVAENFRDLIKLDFNTTLAIEAMTPNLVDNADSVNELINGGCPNGPKPLGQPTFSSRADFITGQSGQKPIPFKILKVWNNCDTVIMRWRSSKPGFVQPEQPVTGIVVMETIPNPAGPDSEQPWQIETIYSEFNSGAWLVDIGNFTAKCS